MNDFAVSQIERDAKDWADRDTCLVCGKPVWDGTDVFFSSEFQRCVHDRCVENSLVFSMEKLRNQVRQLGRDIAKESGLIRLVEWLNRRLS